MNENITDEFWHNTNPPSPLLMSTADSEAETYSFFSPLNMILVKTITGNVVWAQYQVFALVDLQSKMKYFLDPLEL